MKRPWAILTAFAACLAVVLAALAWVSIVAIRLDRRDAEVQRDAELEERARLALWRLDSALGPSIAREDSRPWYEYRAFYPPSVAFDADLNPIPPGGVMLPSSLLARGTPFVKLHFQIAPDGRVSSPMVPEGPIAAAAEAQLAQGDRLAPAAESLRVLADRLDHGVLLDAAPPVDQTTPVRPEFASRVALAPQAEQADWALQNFRAGAQVRQQAAPPGRRRTGRGRNQPDQQQLRSRLELGQRQRAAIENELMNTINRKANPNTVGLLPDPASAAPPAAPDDRSARPLVREGAMAAVWMDGRLLLVRRVMLDQQVHIQGCWLDWDAIRTWLLGRVIDLLPEADVVPADGAATEAAALRPHRLATLPARLVPGALPGEREPLSAATRSALLIAWVCTLLATGAVFMLVWGMLVLGERRSAFVSAVTHELRTPLTTFRMYTQMLADGMVTDPRHRHAYLTTLRHESDRLSHLVENVLAYARLERGRPAAGDADVAVGDMIDRIAPRLRQRAEQAAMTLVVTIDERTRLTTVRTDGAAVEQILFNLVDNACKYATADDRRIHIGAEADARRLRLTVEDHGPGVGLDVRRRLFAPFSKSARAAANSAAGVGLGLALCRRLARRLGGDLRLARSGADGCRFELTLRLSDAPRLAAGPGG